MFRKLWNIITIIFRYLKRNISLKRVALAVNIGVAVSILFLSFTLTEMLTDLDRGMEVFHNYFRREFNFLTTTTKELGELTIENDLHQLEITREIIGVTKRIQNNIDIIGNIIKKLQEKLALSKLIRIENIEDIKKANLYIINVTKYYLGSGSHIKIGNKSYVLTCAHLMDNSEDHLWVSINEDIFPLKLIKIDNHYDLALYRIHTSMKDYPYLEISNEYPKEGSEIVVIGNPAGVEDVITDGIIAKIEKDRYIFTNKSFFGNSGGSLLYQGKIVGVVVSTSVYYEYPVFVNYGQAVKLKVIKRFMEDINE